MLSVAVVDYDCGNMFSIIRALEGFSVKTSITHDPEVIIRADKLILPGVGAYGEGMRKLRERGLSEAVKDFAKSGKPLLGICLGMQLLVNSSEEFGFNEGLGLISGETVALKPKGNEKIPHVGWNSLWAPASHSSEFWRSSLLNDFSEGKDVYFIHSFIVKTNNSKDCLAVTRYAGVEFASAIKKDNITGCQFHPEKSGRNGVKMVENFVVN
ncbi:MAG: imidazole glycerol phosphate synthase subunit HisH [Candidatus Omnitrophota bacterium]